MVPNNFLLNNCYGKKSTLDKAYSKYINNLTNTLSEEEVNRWETYSTIIELLVAEGKKNYLSELKYRVSDGENPNNVILSILDREMENIDGVMWFFKRRIEEYIEDDMVKKFVD